MYPEVACSAPFINTCSRFPPLPLQLSLILSCSFLFRTRLKFSCPHSSLARLALVPHFRFHLSCLIIAKTVAQRSVSRAERHGWSVLCVDSCCITEERPGGHSGDCWLYRAVEYVAERVLIPGNPCNKNNMLWSTHRCTFHFEVRYRRPAQSSAQSPAGSCARRWRSKCAQPIPLPTEGPLALLGAVGLSKLHTTRKCPCWAVDYGGTLHRWCTGAVHYVDAQLVRKQANARADIRGLVRLQGKVQTRITDYYIVAKKS